MTTPAFQTATAAAAAAAAARAGGTPMHQLNAEAPEMDAAADNGQWAVVEERSYMDGTQSSRSARTLDEASDYPQYGWVDITKEFFGACADLELGELAQIAVFGLFEAMSAIEMMDPKMDVGMGYNKQDAPPHTFESAVVAGVLKLDNLSHEELIGIFDALFACIVSWLEGNSMDQVLFTCLYLHSPHTIKDRSLHAFCYAVRMLITLITNIIIASNVNEEEDFQLYGNSSFLAIEDSLLPMAVVQQLKDAEDELARHCRNLSQSPAHKVEAEDTMAVVHRLRFMRHFLHTISLFEHAMNTAPGNNLLNEVYKNLNAMLELVPLTRKTIDRGTQPLPGSDAPNPMGFSPRIHDRSQPPTFPRSIKIRDRPSSLQFLEELVQRMKYACKVLRLKDYYNVLNFFIEFSRKSGQCILSRSILQNLFISKRRLIFGTMPIKDFLWDSVRAFNSPPVLNPKHALANDRNIQLLMDNFFRYVISTNTFTMLIRICGHNRARQRDKLSRFIENFNALQFEAARLDAQLDTLANDKAQEGGAEASMLAASLKYSSQFSTWVVYTTFRAILLFLFSGFELELYSVHEYMYIYWYPYGLLLGFMISALKRTENNVLAQEEYAEHQQKLQGRRNKPKKNKKQQRPYRQEIVYYHAMNSMCGGFYKAMGALTKDGRIRQPMPKFDNEEIRFTRRFLPFAHISSPPPVNYNEFKNIREHMMRSTSAEIYAVAAKHFDQARSVLESIQNPEQDILDMLHVAKINYVVMNVLANGHQKDLKKQPEFDFSRHRHFPIIKLT